MMQIIYKGGQDMDGSRGESINFTRESYFILEGVPLPLFLVSRFIPRRNAIHPRYPWFVAEESKITKNVEMTDGNRGVTVSTTYRALKMQEEPNENNIKPDEVTWANFPWLLPAQDYKLGSMRLEESMDCLYRYGKKEERDLEDALSKQEGDDQIERWRKIPFETSAQTKLTGSRQRLLTTVSFWYYMMREWMEGDDFVKYVNKVNTEDMVIAGEKYKKGEVLIHDIKPEEDKWEHDGGSFFLIWKVAIQLHIDKNTWERQYENVATVFNAYDFKWKDGFNSQNSLPFNNRVLDINEANHQPAYTNNKFGRHKIYHTLYDPKPEKKTDQDGNEYYLPNPNNMIQFFGTKEECYRLNGDVDPTEVTDPMYLDQEGRIIWPNLKTGIIEPSLSPKIKGYPFEPYDFKKMKLPTKR